MFGPAIRLLAITLLTVLLPLAGAVLSGQPLSSLLHFPLHVRGWDPAPINAALTDAAQLFAILLVGALLWLCWPRKRKRPDIADGQRRTAQRPWPRYVWLSLLVLIAALIAIDGQAFNAAIGLLTLALTLLLNANTERRTGSSLISQRRGYFLLLFPASLAAGWLVFYWLNLFIGVWTYPSATEAVPFALGKSLDYASLLPALLSLRQWLGSFPRLLRWTQSGLPLGDRGQAGWPLIGLASLALASGAVWPDQLYPLMLIAPSILALGLQIAAHQATSLSGIAQGDWSRPLLTTAAAALLMAYSQAINLLLGSLTSASPAWAYQLPLLGGIELLGLPAPAWLITLPLALLGLWLADQLTEPFKRRPQQPPFRPRSPVQIPVVDLLREQKRR
ncbi:hypothetical protein U5801_12790 [Lamprobacter modestohalophilus]|uniref:hypothetical protein n=1 Tax=Lamprobacter modestohalophilus TaxID=1064514 RepID=UPI002ADEB902|nr:hypothetical protein [Lamprobacter modestohalophilus]MEA1050677.1 hypothetical protein [Lamprobacter modestohalophilus]